MSFHNYSSAQGPRSNFGVTPRQSIQNTSYGSRVQSNSISNNRLHYPSQSNQNTYGRYSQMPNVQSAGSSQYLHSSPSNAYQGRQSQYGHSQVGRSASPLGGGPMTVSLPPRMLSSSNVTPQSQSQYSTAVQPFQGQQNLPGETGPGGVKYIPLNWEDILGGKDGMKGLQVSMAPSGDPGNPNRQLKFSFATPGQGDAPTAPGEVPLKVVSFQPLQDYPGKGGKPITMNMNSQQMQQALPSAKPSGYQMQQAQSQYQPRSQVSQPAQTTPMMTGPRNLKPGQSQMIMMPPVYYSPGKGIISGPGGQPINSCSGCPNCKGNSNNAQPRINQRQ